jgi:hypothetical protein
VRHPGETSRLRVLENHNPKPSGVDVGAMLSVTNRSSRGRHALHHLSTLSLTSYPVNSVGFILEINLRDRRRDESVCRTELIYFVATAIDYI